MKTQLIISIKIFTVLTVLCGIIYPLLITGFTQSIFPEKANGSLIIENNKIVGSELIGQKFDSACYFQSRPSAVNYNPLPSGGSNLGPINEKLNEQVAERSKQWGQSNPKVSAEKIPAEMVFASASGLDPHISPTAALLQIDRIVEARNLTDAQRQQIVELVNELTEKPQFSLLGESRINVLKLNMALDKQYKHNNH
jgi:K+-transporting ATPase ATPase C chain